MATDMKSARIDHEIVGDGATTDTLRTFGW